MLRHTFLHLSGIGAKKEAALWRSGIMTIEGLANSYQHQLSLLPDNSSNETPKETCLSVEALRARDADFFADRLPPSQHYRIALSYPKQTAFLDIETTGLSHYYDELTVIGATMNGEYRCFIANSGVEQLEEFNQFLGHAKCVVTFNGTQFDLKFLRLKSPDTPIPQAHVDLRYFAKRLGYSGGQKKTEADLGLTRDDFIKGVDGEQAPLLWHNYRLGKIDEAKALILYNFADVEGLRFIFNELVQLQQQQEEIPSGLVAKSVFAKRSPKIKFARSKNTRQKNRIYIPRFGGKSGPRITYKELITEARFRSPVVVGIDLTGSENRSSGWSVLSGDEAHAKCISTDLELVAQTVRQSPDLVSIDSPLSLPAGRLTVDDADPGRDEFGIMRLCERMLKKRGVNVYPCLLPSMQKLTQRGTMLAEKFRSFGIPVIESYPGAAQDIIGIPRKQAGLEYLRSGLHDFGIKGSYLLRNHNHDELDAVTAALVGLFFWSGRFEGLGSAEEDYLIIPDLSVNPLPWRSRLVVGLSGPIAAGKTTGARMLEKIGYSYTRFSKVLANLLQERGEEVNRETLQAFGERVNKYPGQRWFGHQVASSVGDAPVIVIDGLRFPEDHATFVELYGPRFLHIHVKATAENRRCRSSTDGVSAEKFIEASKHPVERGGWELERMAHHVIHNDKELAEFRDLLTQCIETRFGQSGGQRYANNNRRGRPVRVRGKRQSRALSF